jgi:glycosyltransferase involved in cell wall biosynthesis
MNLIRVKQINNDLRTHWVSCYKIQQSLIEIYRQLGEVELVSRDDWDRVDVCVFTDYRYSLTDFVQVAKNLDSHSREVKWIFNCYGNFLFDVDFWLTVEPLLLNRKVMFCFSSQSFENYARRCFVNPQNVWRLPFIVSLAKLSQTDVTSSKSDITFLYAGRLSLQKNIHVLIEAFANFCNLSDSRTSKLVLAGAFDDLAIPEENVMHSIGTYEAFIRQLISSLSGEIRQRIEMPGFLEQDELERLYQRSHVFVSLSTFYQEDFGHAAGEALANGLPLILTKWGGHLDYLEVFLNEAIGVNVRFKEQRTEVCSKDVAYKMLQIEHTRPERLRVRKAYECHVLETKKKYRHLITSFPFSEFKGFSSQFRSLGESRSSKEERIQILRTLLC